MQSQGGSLVKHLLGLVAIAVSCLVATSGTAVADRLYQDTIISSANGGGLVSDNGNVQWYLPAGAYGTDLKVRYTQKTMAHFPGNSATYSTYILAAQPFNLDIMVLDGGESVNVNKPAIMTIGYNPAELGGRSESTLRIAKFDGAYEQWFGFPSSVDTVHHLVTAETSEPGDYGLIVDNAAPVSAAPTAAPSAPTAPQEPVPASSVALAPNPAPVETVPMSSGITGRVFYDKNGNGVMDGDDFPIAGAGLKISSGTWSALTTAGPDGRYAFWDLRESNYNVQLVVGPEWAFTTPNVASGIKVTGQPDSRGTADFGMWYRLP
jgi:hypothetical protein